MPWQNLRDEIEAEFEELSKPDPELAHKAAAWLANKLATYRKEYDARPHARRRRDEYFKRYYAEHKAEIAAKHKIYYAQEHVKARRRKR